MGVERFSRRDSDSSALDQAPRRWTSEFTVSRRSWSASNTPSTIASTVDWIAISGVRSSCATSVVRRRSSSRSFSTDSAISSQRLAQLGDLVVAAQLGAADRLPSLISLAVLVMRLMGLTRPRANRKPQHDASTMATTVAIAMAWYELLRNSSSAERRSVSDPSTHTFTEPTAWAVHLDGGGGHLVGRGVLGRKRGVAEAALRGLRSDPRGIERDRRRAVGVVGDRVVDHADADAGRHRQHRARGQHRLAVESAGLLVAVGDLLGGDWSRPIPCCRACRSGNAAPTQTTPRRWRPARSSRR